jgi:hypothetical protein
MLSPNSRFILNRSHSQTRLAVRMTMTITLGVMLLAAIFGGVSAARDPGSEPPNCGDNPACGYIQMHALDEELVDCGDLPICGYIQMHSQSGYSTLAQSLTGQILLAASDPQLMVSRTTLVRSSPDTAAFSYGELPERAVSAVIGVSQDAAWLVIPLPLNIAPDGVGWVEAADVTASNVRSDSDVAIMCDATPICDYIKAHQRQVVSVMEPTYAVALLLGQPMIAMTGR